MTKQELMENFTIEELADKIIALNIAISDMKNTEKIIEKYNEKIESDKTIAYFLQAEPIKIADALIDKFTEGSKSFCYNEYMERQEIKCLRQIAEHLLVYCNANREEKE